MEQTYPKDKQMEPSEGKHMNQMLAYFEKWNKGVTTATPNKKDWLGLAVTKLKSVCLSVG